MRASPLLIALLVSGCAAPEAPPAEPTPPNVTPAAPGEARQTPEVALNEALLAIYGPETGEVRYFSGQIDLDGDGVDEIIAHVAGPTVCGSGGCTTLVFTPEGSGLRRVADVSVSRPPIVAAETRTNGWRDLVVSVSGGGAQSGQALLAFDGTAYPGNPTVAPAQALGEAPPGTVVIAPFESYTSGTLLRAETP